jgi:hypothetical protein
VQPLDVGQELRLPSGFVARPFATTHCIPSQARGAGARSRLELRARPRSPRSSPAAPAARSTPSLSEARPCRVLSLSLVAAVHHVRFVPYRATCCTAPSAS